MLKNTVFLVKQGSVLYSFHNISDHTRLKQLAQTGVTELHLFIAYVPDRTTGYVCLAQYPVGLPVISPKIQTPMAMQLNNTHKRHQKYLVREPEGWSISSGGKNADVDFWQGAHL